MSSLKPRIFQYGNMLLNRPLAKTHPIESQCVLCKSRPPPQSLHIAQIALFSYRPQKAKPDLNACLSFERRFPNACQYQMPNRIAPRRGCELVPSNISILMLEVRIAINLPPWSIILFRTHWKPILLYLARYIRSRHRLVMPASMGRRLIFESVPGLS